MEMLIDAVCDIVSPSFNIYVVWLASSQCINTYFGVGIGLFVVNDISRYLLHDEII